MKKVKIEMLHRFYHRLFGGLILAVFLGSSSMAQAPLLQIENNSDVVPTQSLVFLLQGEKSWITDDYIAELDANSRLRVSLSDSGLSTPTRTDEFLVTLIQSDGSSIEKSPDADGNLIFENVAQGWGALVVVAKSAAVSSQTAMYAAMPILASQPVADKPAKSPVSVHVASVDPKRLVSDLNQTSTPATSTAELLPADAFEVASAASIYQVKLGADGMVRGRVVVPQRGFEAVPGVTQLVFYRNGIYQTSTSSAATGEFVVGLEPGMNSVVATGPAGHAAFSFEVVANNEGRLLSPTAGNIDAKTPKFVSVAVQASDSLTVVLVPPSLMPEVRRVVDRTFNPLAPAPQPIAGPAAPGFAPGGGGFGPGGGGFGGGGAGGGGVGLGGGGALGIAGLALGAAALAASDDDGFNANLASLIAPGPAAAPAAPVTPQSPTPPFESE